MTKEDAARFGKLWIEWDRRVAVGELPRAILRNAMDEELIGLLAGESHQDRQYARDIIATEILNRMHRRSVTQHPGAQTVEDSARTSHEVAQEGQMAIHHAEGILKASGEFELGAAVSASADASLHAAEAAFDSAKIQVDALRKTLAQSRVGTELAAEAATVAGEGIEVTRELEGKMDAIGRGEEGRAASEASRDIKKAADVAAEDSADHDAQLHSE